MSPPKALAIVAGFGPGISHAVARRFAHAYDLVLLGRSLDTLPATPVGSSSVPSSSSDAVKSIFADPVLATLPSPPTISCFKADVTDASSISAAFTQIKALQQPVAVAFYNVSSPFQRAPFLETNPDSYLTSFKGSTYGAVLYAQQALPLLLAHANSSPELSPTLLFTGATASYKSNAQMSPFSSAKFGLRALVQSLAHEFAPQRVHVATVNIDAVVDLPKVSGYLNEQEDMKLKPEDVAETYWGLHAQRKSAWTWEVDVRPWTESW
ncbi:oxidoreductase [Myxozyma melibiosi]|uniref:Oxidoreductase n=1 Tax=Myxozyma melibiosi TaxID=54550 RepID=A0ABR1F3N1_9ASCO